MALTKAQISLVTVATLGAAPGGFTADLANFGSQKEVANLIATLGTPEFTTMTNAEFVNNVAKNLGTTVQAKDKIAFLKALDEGTSRAEAAVDFANAQLVEHGSIHNVDTAAKSTSTSTDLAELAEVVTPVNADLTVDLKEGTPTTTTTTPPTPPTTFTTSNLGKDQFDAGTPKISSDFNFELKNQIGEDKTYEAKFISPTLAAGQPDKSASELLLQLLDLREPEGSATPLGNLKTDGFAFLLDGVALLIKSDAIYAAKTYEALSDAINARVAELVLGVKLPDGKNGESSNAADYQKLATFTAKVGGNFKVKNESGATVTGKNIEFTDSSGSTLEGVTFVDTTKLDINPGFNFYGDFGEVTESSDIGKLISTNLDADNVGYGSQGASVNIAGQSASDKGVEELKLTAKNGVWFTTLESETENGTNHLQSIQLQSGSEGYFNVGSQKGKSVVDLKDEQFGDNTVTGKKGAGLTDVREVVANNAGSTAINSFISKDVLNREYNTKDTGAFGSDDVAINYNLSSGRDVLNLAVDQKVMEAVDTKINIDTGAGDDVIHFQVTNSLTAGQVNKAGNGSWLTNQQLLDNVVVNAGDGNDQVVLTGAGNVTVNAGTGDDEVRADNSGGLAVFLFNNGNTSNLATLSNSDNALSSSANGVAQTYNLFKATVKVTFLGFESKAIVIDSTNFKTSTLQINQAIKKAIAESPQLSKLLAAHDNAGNALGLESLVDGKLNLSDLKISITAPADYKANETAAEQAARVASGQEMLSSTDLLDAAKSVNPTTTTPISISELTNAANSLNNSVYNAEFATTDTNLDNINIPQIQTIDFKGISSLPAGHKLSGDGAVVKITVSTGLDAEVKVTAGMTSADIAKAAANALSQAYAKTNITSFLKAEAVGEQVKVYFNDNSPALTAAVTTNGTTFLSTKALPTSVITSQSTTGNTVAAAAVDSKATINFAGIDVPITSPANGQIEVTIGSTKTLVTVAPGLGGLGLAKAVQEALNGKTVTVGGTESLTVTTSVLDETVTLNMKGVGTGVTVTLANAPTAPSATVGSFPTPSVTPYSAPVTAVAGTHTANLEFAGHQVTEAGNIVIGGISIALAKGDDDREIAKKVVEALNTKVIENADVTANTSGTDVVLSLVGKTTGTITPISDIAISNITAGFANTKADPTVSFTQAFVKLGDKIIVDGKNSDAESDNRIDLGQGTDLVMMGTGKNSNDTLVLTGYKTQTNTVVNFDGNANSKGVDYLDLSAYVAGQNKVVLGSVSNASGTMADKAVAKTSVTAAQFATLTDAEILAQLNGTADAAKQIANLKSIDAATGGTANSNYVLMVENAGNVGEYKVFHLTATAGDNKGAFANAQTVATLDFGAKVVTSVMPIHTQATLSNTTGDLVGYKAAGDHEVIKGLALTVSGDTILSAETVKTLNDLALEELTLRSSSVVSHTITLPYGETLNVGNLTVWTGTFDVSAGTLNVSGTITLNSSLKVSVDQALALIAAGTKIKSDSGTPSKLDVVVNTPAEAAKLDAAAVTKLKALLSGVVSVTGSGASAKDAAGGALYPTIKVADIGTTTGSYNLSDTAAELAGASATQLNAAVNITATDAVGATLAKTLADATNSGSTTYSITEATAAALIAIAKDATVAAKTGLAGASSITATDLGEVVTFDNLTAAAAATKIKFVDNAATLALADFDTLTGSIGLTAADVITVTGVANTDLTTLLPKLEGDNDIIAFASGSVTLTETQLKSIATAKVALTAADTITVTDVTATGGKFAEADTINLLNTGDIITADSNAITLTAANYKAVFNTAGVLATAGDAITVNTLTGATVAATAATDTFVFAATDTNVTINSFTTGTDKVDLKAFSLTAGTVADPATIVASEIYTITGAVAGAADSVANAATAIDTALDGTGTLVDATDGDVAYFTVVDDNSSAIYKYTATNAETGVTATELELIGTFDAQIAAADFVLA